MNPRPATAVRCVLAHPGAPEAIGFERVELAPPGPGEVLVRQHAIGVNFIDTYQRSGLYPLALPSGLGIEAAGTVEAVGHGVRGLRPGARVAYAGGPPGAYASRRLVDAARLVRLPETVSFECAASVLLKGLTVHMLLHRLRRLARGETIVVHAAAGGVGLILGQWARALGLVAIGTAGGPRKCALAAGHGYAHTVDYDREDFVARVRELTGGRGVPMVLDSVGRRTFEGSLACLGPRGLLVSFGDASGPPPPVSCTQLGRAGSLFVTRPVVTHYTARRDALLGAARALFERLARGDVRPPDPTRYPLADAARCHADLEARRTSGSVVLVPD